MRIPTLISGLVALTVSLVGVTPALASPPWHAFIESYQGSQVEVGMRTLQEAQYATCELDGYSCTKTQDVATSLLPEHLKQGRIYWNQDHSLAIQENKESVTWSVFGLTGSVAQRTIEAPDDRVYRALLSHDGGRVLLMTGTNIYLYGEKATPSQIIPFERSGANFLTLSKNGRYLAYYRSARLPLYQDNGEEEKTVSPEDADKEQDSEASQEEAEAPTEEEDDNTLEPREFGVVDLEKGTVLAKQDKAVLWDLLSEQERLFSFTPDEQFLLYIDDTDGYPVLYALDLSTSFVEESFVSEQLITKKYSVSDFWVTGNDTVYFAANRTGPYSWDLYRYNFKSYDLERVTEDISYFYPMRIIDNNLVFHKGAEGNTQMYALGLDTEKLHRLAVEPQGEDIHTDTINTKGEVFSVPSGGSALLQLPESKTKSYPLVVWLHGGPYRQASAGYHPYPSYSTYDWMREELRDQGFATLAVDYQGSYGSGREVAEGIQGNVGVTDVADVLSAIKQVKSEITVDRVYLMGNSYGGYLSLKTLVSDSSVVDGAISLSGVTEWANIVSGYPNSIFREHFGGAPWEEEAQPAYIDASVVDYLDEIDNEKVLLFHGDEDSSVGYSQATFLESFLKSAGKSVELVTWEGVGHIPKGKDLLINTCNKISSFVGGSGSCTW